MYGLISPLLRARTQTTQVFIAHTLLPRRCLVTHLSKGVIDREPKRVVQSLGMHHDGDGQKSENLYWDHKTRGYTNIGHGWPRSSRPHLAKDIIYRV